MAAIKISTLTAKTVPVAADSFVIVDSAAADNKKVSYSDLRSTILDAETTINESGADVDFRVESDTKTHAIFVQGSDGFVGINKLVPTRQLDVGGAIAAGDAYLDGTVTINEGFDTKNFTVFDSVGTETIFSDGTTGFVGIGTGTPTRQLDVVGNTSLDGAVIINEGAIDVDFEVRGDSQTNALFVQGSNGNVGIFTGTPATELEVNGNIAFTNNNSQGITVYRVTGVSGKGALPSGDTMSRLDGIEHQVGGDGVGGRSLIRQWGIEENAAGFRNCMYFETLHEAFADTNAHDIVVFNSLPNFASWGDDYIVTVIADINAHCTAAAGRYGGFARYKWMFSTYDGAAGFNFDSNGASGTALISPTVLATQGGSPSWTPNPTLVATSDQSFDIRADRILELVDIDTEYYTRLQVYIGLGGI